MDTIQNDYGAIDSDLKLHTTPNVKVNQKETQIIEISTSSCCQNPVAPISFYFKFNLAINLFNFISLIFDNNNFKKWFPLCNSAETVRKLN